MEIMDAWSVDIGGIIVITELLVRGLLWPFAFFVNLYINFSQQEQKMSGIDIAFVYI